MKYLILFVFLYSCSAEYHLNKAIKKGYLCEDTLQMDTIRIATIDSVPVIVNNEIIYEKFITQKDTIVKWKTKNVYVPKTKWKIKQELRFQRDTIRIREKTKQAEAKAEVKSKKRPNLNFLFIGVAIGFILSYLLRRLDAKI